MENVRLPAQSLTPELGAQVPRACGHDWCEPQGEVAPLRCPGLQDCSGVLELAGTAWGSFLCSSNGHAALMRQALPCPLPSVKLNYSSLYKNSRTSRVTARPATSPSIISEPDKRLLLGSGFHSPREMNFCFS